MKRNLKPAFRQHMEECLQGLGIFFLALLVITLIFAILAGHSTESDFSLNGLGLYVGLYMFTAGIMVSRSHTRLCLQFGVSRRTAFWNMLICAAVSSAILATVCEILDFLIMLFHSRFLFMRYADFYQMIYLEKITGGSLDFTSHCISAAINWSLSMFLFTVGMFVSFLFWRLNRFWTIASVILIIFVFNIFSPIASFLHLDFRPVLHWLQASPGNLILTFLLFSVAFGVLSWLPLRRVNIRTAVAK